MCVMEWLNYKCLKRAYLVIVIIFLIILTGLILQYEHRKNVSTICKDNMSCPAHWICCDMGCCSPVTASPGTEADDADDPWYKQWPVIFFVCLLGWILICCLFFCRRNRQSCGGLTLRCLYCNGAQHDMEVDSAGSLYPPPRYSRCGSFPHAPPPYSEVQSKPDQYPLVITCAEGDAKHGRRGSYLMVHYFKNRVIRPPQGCLSPTSTAESLSSSLICNTSNGSDSVIPPPYSSSNNFGNGVGGWRSMLRSVSSLHEPRPVHLRTNPFPHHPQDRRDALQWNDLDMVQSKPYVYPLAYTCAEGDAKHGRGGRYLMGHFFKNRVIRPPQGSLSPTSTAESLNSSLICNTSNGDQAYDPTHSHAMRPDHLGCEMYREYWRHTLSEDNIFEPEAYEERRVIHPSPTEPLDFPPQPTHPEESLKQTEDRRQRRLDSTKRIIRKSSLYMPLSTAPVRPSRISPGTRASSRSAPATPSTNLVPNLLNFTHRARYSSRTSRLEEEYNALIMDMEQHADHKF